MKAPAQLLASCAQRQEQGAQRGHAQDDASHIGQALAHALAAAALGLGQAQRLNGQHRKDTWHQIEQQPAYKGRAQGQKIGAQVLRGVGQRLRRRICKGGGWRGPRLLYLGLAAHCLLAHRKKHRDSGGAGVSLGRQGQHTAPLSAFPALYARARLRLRLGRRQRAGGKNCGSLGEYRQIFAPPGLRQTSRSNA